MPPNRAHINAEEDMAYSAKAVSVTDSLLKILSRHHPEPLRIGNISVHYTTGRVQTEQRNGPQVLGSVWSRCFEARAKVPAAHGENAAFWLMPEGTVPRYTEFDILESLGKNSTVAYGTYHYGETAMADDVYHSHRHLLSSGAAFVSAEPLSAAFHVYGLLWTGEGTDTAARALHLQGPDLTGTYIYKAQT